MTRIETVAAQKDAAWEELKAQQDAAWRAEVQQLLEWDQAIEDELGPVFIPRSKEDDEDEDNLVDDGSDPSVDEVAA